MYQISGNKSKLGLGFDWKQLLPQCSNRNCSNAGLWGGMLHRGSGFWLNEREWFCGERCLQASLEQRILASFFDLPRPAPIRTTTPMGLMLVARGVITGDQLRQALETSRSGGGKIGACLVSMGLISYDDIASVVAAQWGCPIYPAGSVQPGCSMFVPISLLERYRMLPVHLVTQGPRLFVGFSDMVNHAALYCIEQMLGCRTEACVIPEPKFHEVLEYRKLDTTGEVTLTRPGTAAETAHMICNYAQQTGANALRFSSLEGNIWVRMFSRRSHLDLVFELSRL